LDIYGSIHRRRSRSLLAAHGAEIMADIPRYTNIEPVFQISEVKISLARVASVAGE
jgi:hypothetical protein